MTHKTWMEHWTAAVFVPAAWAIVSALFVSFASFMVALAFQLATGEGDPRFWSLTLGALTLPAVWLYALDWWVKQITPARPPSIEAPSTALTFYQNTGSPYITGYFDNLQLPKSKLTAACQELVERSFRTGALGGAGKVLSRSQAETLRDYMVKRGLAFRDNPSQTNSPWTITREGKTWVMEKAGFTPPLEVSDTGNWRETGKNDAHTYRRRQ